MSYLLAKSANQSFLSSVNFLPQLLHFFSGRLPMVFV